MKPVSMRPRGAAVAPRLADVHHAIVSCEACPRLRGYCARIAVEKKPAHRGDTYWGRPVPGFGDHSARLLLVALAPAAHGANRTGRVFTGDGASGSSGFLMAALHRAGLANRSVSESIDDGLALRDVFITSAVRCAPPDNRPFPDEIARCGGGDCVGQDRLRRVARAGTAPRRTARAAASVRPWSGHRYRPRAPTPRHRAVPVGEFSPQPAEHQHRPPDGRNDGRDLRDCELAAALARTEKRPAGCRRSGVFRNRMVVGTAARWFPASVGRSYPAAARGTAYGTRRSPHPSWPP
jgi:uracil-DNA glycosylase